MSNEPSSSKNVIDNIQVPVRTGSEEPKTPLVSSHTIPFTTGGSQEAPGVSSSSVFVTNANGRQNIPYAPVRQASQIQSAIAPREPQLPRYASNDRQSKSVEFSSATPQNYIPPPNPQLFSSPETILHGFQTQSPQWLPANYQATAMNIPGQRQQYRSNSLPQAPSYIVHPQSRPRFYTPQLPQMYHPLSPSPVRTPYPVHSSQFPLIPVNLSSQQPNYHQIPPTSSIAMGRQRQTLAQGSDSFVANDPFRAHTEGKKENVDLTFDDIDITPVQANWGQYPGMNAYDHFHEDKITEMPSSSPWGQPSQPSWNQPQQSLSQPQQYWNQPQQPWSQSQKPWGRPHPDSPVSVPSSWGQIYSPFTLYPTQIGGEGNLEGQTTWEPPPKASELRPGWGLPYFSPNWYQPSDVSIPSTQYPSGEFNAYRPPPVLTPSSQISPKASPVLEQPRPNVQNTTDEPIQQPVLEDPLPEGQPQGSPQPSPEHSSGHSPENITVEKPTEGQTPDPLYDHPPSSFNHPAPTFRTYVTVNSPGSGDSPFGPYTEHRPIDPSNISPEFYPYYYQIQDGQINRPPIVGNVGTKSSFWSNLKDFVIWPFAQGTSHSRPEYILPYHIYPTTINISKPRASLTHVVVQLVARTLPRQMYLHLLLRLPSLYFSRVARIFEEADLTLREIKKMALEMALTDKGQVDLHIFESKNIPPQYTRLKSTWEAFIDSVMREWKTFNIISVLLLSAILTILQIESAAQDPITRYTALSSLICALISLLFGCMYIIRFGSMRKTYKAAEWALEAQKTRTTVWWNVWVLLAMPAIWLTWSIILYIVCIMSFVWQSSAEADLNLPSMHMSKTALLAVRVVMSVVLGLGILYGGLILSTFSQYGEVMDNTWKRRINQWIEERKIVNYSYGPANFDQRHQTPLYYSGLPPNLQPQPIQPGSNPLGLDLSPTPSAFGLPNFGPTFQPTSPPQTSSVPPLTFSSPTPSSPPGEFSYAGYGYFSDRKTLFTEFETAEPPSFFVPPTEAQESEASSPLRQDSASSALSSLHGILSDEHAGQPQEPKPSALLQDFSRHNRSYTRLAVSPSPSLPPIPRTPGSSIPMSVVEAGSPVSEENISGFGNETVEYGERVDAGQESRTVRFRSPLVSPQLESSIQGNEEDVVESVRSNFADPSTLATTDP